MKKMPKDLLDAYIDASCAYWKGYMDSERKQAKRLNVKMEASFDLADAIGVEWLSIQNFIDGILNVKGICPDAENDEIYCALRCLGWDTVE